jgi:glycosyltransferase involved in cell wall biosynthesis
MSRAPSSIHPDDVDISVVHRWVRQVKRWVQHERLRLPERIQQARAWLAARRAEFVAPQLGVFWQYPPRVLHFSCSRRRKLRAAPRISIVTPSFNQGVFLERTLQSVLRQHYPDLEYCVQDGGSTDGTAAVLERYREQLAHYESGRDDGQADAINRAFAHTTGAILAWLNSDDLLLPGALDFVARYFARHPRVDVVYGHRVVIDEHDGEVGRWVMPPHDAAALTWCDFVPQETLFWRRSIWEKVGARLDDSFQFALDWDLLLRFQEAGARIVRVNRFLGAFRVHGAQKTSLQLYNLGADEMQRLRLRCHGRPVSDVEVGQRILPYMRRQGWYNRLWRLGLFRAA